MSRDYNDIIVVGWEKINGVNVPIDEHGHYLDHNSIRPVEPQPIWDYKNHCPSGKVRSPREVAKYNLCYQELVGNKRKFYWATELTNPYGCLHWAIGNSDDFHCFDYNFLPDGRVILDATINSETGSFIQGAGYEICSKEDAPDVALGMVDNACSWLCCTVQDSLSHNKTGWNQDPYYFYRCVKLACSKNAPDFSERQMRFGGKKINQYCQLAS